MKNLDRLAAFAVGFAAVLAPLTAQGAWLSAGRGQGQATATSVNKAAQPTATKNAQNSPGSPRVVPAVTLSWAATTLASGAPVGSYEVRRHSDNGSTVVCTVTAPATSCDDTAPLMGAVSYGVVARIGANWVGPESDLAKFQYDTTAPVTTATQSPAPNAAGWNKSDTTVTLTATDQESGVKSITYAVNGGASTTVNATSATVPVSTEGTQTITYSATDNAGNTATTKTYSLKLDKSAPTVTATGTTANGGTVASGGTSYSPVTLSLAATDGLSGVQSLSYRIGSATAVTTTGSSASVPIGASGTTSVQYWATDVAGNASAVQTYTVTIAADTTRPVFGGDGIIGITAGGSYSTHDNSSGWADICNGLDAICASVSDPGSGIASVTYTLQGVDGDHAGECWDGASWTSASTCPVAMTLTGGIYQSTRIGHEDMDTGSYALTVVATDVAGNQAVLSLNFTTDSKK